MHPETRNCKYEKNIHLKYSDALGNHAKSL